MASKVILTDKILFKIGNKIANIARIDIILMSLVYYNI